MPMPLDYPLTRSFRWGWFTPVSIVVGIIVFGFLTVINIPLTGYETITVFRNDFNVTQSQWFHQFMPFQRPKPGSACDTHVFSAGDPFFTNYSFFGWTLESIQLANAGGSGIRYSGTPLTFCDVTSIYLSADLLIRRAEFTVISTCKEESSFGFTAKTSISEDYMPAVASSIMVKPGRNDKIGPVLDYVMRGAAQDFQNRASAALVASDYTTPTALSVRAELPFCPMNLGPQAPCSTQVPLVVITNAATIYRNSTVYTYSDSLDSPDVRQRLLDDNLYAPFLNMIQAVYAAVRIDWGNNSPNNFILNRDVTNATLATIFPATQWIGDRPSALAYDWNQPKPLGLGLGVPYLPVRIGGPASIQVVYLCRFQQPKPAGSLFVSVLVATLSMFSSGWAVFMVIAAAVAQRNDPTANRCEGHSSNPEGRHTPNDVESRSLADMENTTTSSSQSIRQRNPVVDNAAS